MLRLKTRANISCMFTGIVQHTLRVVSVADGPKFRRLVLPNEWTDVREGESIAINGVCLTVVEKPKDVIDFDVIQETLDRTNLGILNAGDEVHVERSLRVGARIDGHFVLGHVDGRAKIIDQQSTAHEWRTRLEVADGLGQYIAPKGSVCLDGISL